MPRIELEDFERSISEQLAGLRPDETIVLCRDGVPIAEVLPLPPRQRTPRELGFAKGQFEVTDAFLEPLPDELLDAFEGCDQHET